MKAIIHDSYGPIERLERRDIEPPTIGEHEVLVRVHAAAVHIGDVFAIQGRPLLVRTATGLRRPKYGVPGLDLAGTVEAVGGAVTRFAVGDEVFGEGAGTAAELARAEEGKAGSEASRDGMVRCGSHHDVRGRGAAWLARRRPPRSRAAGPDRRCVRRRGNVRDPDRQGDGRTCDRGDQHEQRGPCAVARRRRRDRLHARGLHRAPWRVRPDLRQHRGPHAPSRPPGAHPEGHAGAQQRHRSVRSSNAGPPHPAGCAVTVQLADDAALPLDREPCGPRGPQGHGRGRAGQAGDLSDLPARRHGRGAPATSRPDMHAARWSWPSEHGIGGGRP